MSKEKKYRFMLQLNVEEWGAYKKGEIDFFWMNLLDDGNGLVRWPIDKHWTILRCDDFTGKTDKDGESIYENDRVEFKTQDSQGYWSDMIHSGTIQWDEEDACFFIDNDDESYPHVKFQFAKDIQIIKE